MKWKAERMEEAVHITDQFLLQYCKGILQEAMENSILSQSQLEEALAILEEWI